jgi:GT2 family glycosyltransferase
MKLSCIIATRNNCEALQATLDHLAGASGLPAHDRETIVIDNGSTDATPDLLARRRDVRSISLAENQGVPARNFALAQAHGRFVAFLEDDIRPIDRAIANALTYLGRNPMTAAIVARIVLPDGTADAPALPSVLMSGASIVRKSALDKVGGFATEFFRQAADYELSFRLWRAGHCIERFEDLQFARTRMPVRASSPLVCRMDLRNNLILCERFLPRPLRHAYRHDWMRRYALLARQEGRAAVANTAVKESRIWARREAAVGRRLLGPDAIESIFGLADQRDRIAAWARQNRIRRVCIADWGKNLFATYSACRASGLMIHCILDDHPAFAGAEYRTIPVLSESCIDRAGFDGILLSTINPAQVHPRAAALEARFGVPVLRLWEPKQLTRPPPRTASGHPSPAPRPIDRAA